jgi:phage gp16-like protein
MKIQLLSEKEDCNKFKIKNAILIVSGGEVIRFREILL